MATIRRPVVLRTLATSRPDRPGPVRRNAPDECAQRPDGTWTCWPALAASTASVPPDVSDRELETFKVVTDHFRHDLTILWTHSSFFLLIQGVLASALSSVLGSPVPADAPLVGIRARVVFLCLGGLLFACSWAWVAWRSRLFIQCWREQVLHLNGALDRHAVYLRVEPSTPPAWWYGPTSFATYLPIFFVVAWLLALLWLGLEMWL